MTACNRPRKPARHWPKSPAPWRRCAESNTQIAVAAEQQSHVAEEMNRAVVSIRDVTENTVQQTVDSATTSNQLATSWPGS